MPSVKYIIELSDADRRALREVISKGKSPAKAILRANILLASDRNNKKHMTVAEIAETYHTTPTTVQNVRTSYANNGLEATIARKKRETPPVPPKITGDIEAHMKANVWSTGGTGTRRTKYNLTIIPSSVASYSSSPAGRLTNSCSFLRSTSLSGK